MRLCALGREHVVQLLTMCNRSFLKPQLSTLPTSGDPGITRFRNTMSRLIKAMVNTESDIVGNDTAYYLGSGHYNDQIQKVCMDMH